MAPSCKQSPSSKRRHQQSRGQMLLKRMFRHAESPSPELGPLEFVLRLDEQYSLLVRAAPERDCPSPLVRSAAPMTDLELKEKERLSRVPEEQLEKCLTVTVKEVLAASAAHDLVPCVGCRRTLESLLDGLVDTAGGQAGAAAGGGASLEPLFEVSPSGGRFRLKTESLPDRRDDMFHILANCRRRVSELAGEIPRTKNRWRCANHSAAAAAAVSLPDSRQSSANHSPTSSSSPELTSSAAQWSRALFDCTTPECRHDILRVSLSELRQFQKQYVKKHRFCEECVDQLDIACRLLFGLEDSSRYREFDPELFRDVTRLPDDPASSERHVGVRGADEGVLSALMERVRSHQLDQQQQQQHSSGGGGGEPERHARSVDIAQKEMVLCLATLLHRRVHSVVTKRRAHVLCLNLLPPLTLLAVRAKLDQAVDLIEGQLRIEAALREIAAVDAEQRERRLRKKQKRRDKKHGKKPACCHGCGHHLPPAAAAAPASGEDSEACAPAKRTLRGGGGGRDCTPHPRCADPGYSSGDCSPRRRRRTDHSCSRKKKAAAAAVCSPDSGSGSKPASPQPHHADGCAEAGAGAGVMDSPLKQRSNGWRSGCSCGAVSELDQLLSSTLWQSVPENQGGGGGSGCGKQQLLTEAEIREFRLAHTDIARDRRRLRATVRRRFESSLAHGLACHVLKRC